MNNSYAQNKMVDDQSIRIIFPFLIDIDPMEKLLLVNFEKDPDSIYVGFEPQSFNDDVNGVGHLIIGWRTDKKVDVYHQKSLNLDPSKYRIAGSGLNEMIPIDMDKAFYEVSDFGVQAHYKFKDVSGRAVEIAITESNSKKRKPFDYWHQWVMLQPAQHLCLWFCFMISISLERNIQKLPFP